MRETGFYKWELMVWLWLAFFFNQADRQIFNIALPLIKKDLGLTDTQAGLVGSVFVLTLGLCIPFAGLAGDLYSRKKIIVYSLLFWSATTVVTGFSSTLLHLILLRSIALGGGEAFYAPAANGLIGQFHQKTRAVAMGIHQTSLYAGVITSGLAGGWVAENYGWKTCFFLFGGVGIALSLFIAWRLRPTTAQTAPQSTAATTAFMGKAVKAIVGKPSPLLLCGAFLTLVFVNVGYTTWTPTFLHEKFGLTVADAGFRSMFYHHIFAFVGVIGGGILSDKLAQSSSHYRLIIQSCGLLLGAPFIYFLGQASTPDLTYAALAGFGLFRGVYEANLYATLFEVIEPQYRSTAVGLSAMFAYVVAAAAPVLLGYLKPTLGLGGGLSSLSIAYVLGGCFLLVALAKFYKRDSRINLQPA